VGCLRRFQDELPDDYEYIMLSLRQQSGSYLPLLVSLKENPEFTLVYTSSTIYIFQQLEK
jgi:hypothetical protein